MLEFKVYDTEKIVKGKKKEIGKFYIPADASKEFIEKNVPPLIRAIQLLIGKIKETGY
jgi:hypothetical protein